MIKLKLIYYIINTIILAIIIFYLLNINNKKSNKEPFTDGDAITVDEAISNVASIYNEEDMVVSNLTVTQTFNMLPTGTIVMFNGSTVPNGWAICNGENGTPDLRGRFVLSSGQGTGLTNRTLSQTGGAETHTLTISEMPSHNHAYVDKYRRWSNSKNRDDANDRKGAQQDNRLSIDRTTDNTGGGRPHNNMPPYYVLTFIMKL